jgi:hypothetical protein
VSNATRCRAYRQRTIAATWVRDMVRDMLPEIIQGVAELLRHGSDMPHVAGKEGSLLNGFPLKERFPPAPPSKETIPPSLAPLSEKRARVLVRPSIEEWQPSEAHYALGWEKGLSAGDVDDQAESYLDWMRSTGKRHKDLNAGFRNWMKRERTATHVNGRTNGHDELTPANKRYLAGREATYRAILRAEERDRASEAGDET